MKELNLSYHIDAIEFIHRVQNRKWDKDIPYWTHPLWCATMILSEKLLSQKQRHQGAIALMYHDAIESGYEEVVPLEVLDLVKDMTFSGFDEEMLLLMSKSDFVILLKLYDKTSNLLDGHWMTKKRKDEYMLHTMRLIETVKEVYGPLMICKFAEVLINERI